MQTLTCILISWRHFTAFCRKIIILGLIGLHLWDINYFIFDVGSMIVGAMFIGAMNIGAKIVGAMRRPRLHHHSDPINPLDILSRTIFSGCRRISYFSDVKYFTAIGGPSVSLRVKSVRNQHIYLQKKWDTFENSKFHDFSMTFCKSFIASNMNIHYDVTGLLTVVWRSELIAHIRDIQESAGSRQLDR